MKINRQIARIAARHIPATTDAATFLDFLATARHCKQYGSPLTRALLLYGEPGQLVGELHELLSPTYKLTMMVNAGTQSPDSAGLNLFSYKSDFIFQDITDVIGRKYWQQHAKESVSELCVQVSKRDRLAVRNRTADFIFHCQSDVVPMHLLTTGCFIPILTGV